MNGASMALRPAKREVGFSAAAGSPGRWRRAMVRGLPAMCIVVSSGASWMPSQNNYDLDYVLEPGDFEVMIGPNSRDVKKAGLSVE